MSLFKKTSVDENKNENGKFREHKDFISNRKWFISKANELDPMNKNPNMNWDPVTQDLFRITWADTCGYFSISRAKASNRNSESYPISFNQSSGDFQKNFYEAYNFFAKMINGKEIQLNLWERFD